jgi:ATP-binding cassette subfamily B (MDR/TAP) protein 1
MSKEKTKNTTPNSEDESHRLVEQNGDSKMRVPVNEVNSIAIPEENGKDKKEMEKTLPEAPKASFKDLFSFVEGKEKLYLGFGIFFSVIGGAAMPAMTLILGNLTNSFTPNNSPDEVENQISQQFLQMIYLGLGVFLASMISSLLWNFLSSRQTQKIKLLYFQKLLDQNSGWYDKTKIDQLSANFIDQVSSFSEVFSEKMNLLFTYYATAFGGLAIGFIRGWLLTIFILLLTPILFFGMYFFIKVMRQSEEVQRKGYGQAGAVADECFTYIKTVKSLNGEEHEIQQYSKNCKFSMDKSIRFGYKAGILWGTFFFSMLVLYGLAYLIGSRLIADNWINDNFGRVYNVGDVLTVFFSVVTGIFSFGGIGPIMKNLEAAKVAIGLILEIVRKDEGEKSGKLSPLHFKGEIVFENVSFSYPSNPDVMVLKNVSFRISAGQKVAFVGPSGSGKSTIVQLLERFYDPSEGRILLDGFDIREYDIKHLRSKIGLVSQQPILFAETIKYNVLLGMEDHAKVSDADIWKALDEAVASDFVKKFNGQLNEYVGTQGGQLSGGQKQRVAIARALIRNPSIFLFDEATSALDRKNEMEIQKTLDNLASKTTSVTIAHRLTTIINSDRLFVLKNGVLMQSGTHQELYVDQKGLYYTLIEHQMDLPADYSKEDEEQVKDHFNNFADSINNEKGGLSKQSGLKKSKSNHFEEKIADQNDVSNTPKISGSSQNDLSSSKTKEKKEYVKLKSKLTLSQFLGPEKFLIFFGVIAAIGQGSVMPVFGYLFAIVIEKLGSLEYFAAGSNTNPAVSFTKADIVHDIDMIVIGFMVVALGSLLFNTFQYALFNHVGERFTFTIRNRYFRRLLYKDMEYFDQEENQPGSISSRLALDCKSINSLISTYIGAIFQSLSSLLIGIIIAFAFSWRITLVMIGITPILILSGVVRSKIMHATGKKEKLEGSDLLPETLNNMKVVRSLNAEAQIYERFKNYSEIQAKKSNKLAWPISFLFGFSQFTQFLVYAILFRVGAKFQVDYGLTMRDFFIAMFCIMFGAMGTGMASQFMSTAGEAKIASEKILTELNSDSIIETDPMYPDLNSNSRARLKPITVGKIEFKEVDFTYKNRKNKILNKLNILIQPNQTTAFVGSSGCGKSTIMQMLLRFYDPQNGSILIDDVDIRDFDLPYLRSIFGMVRQEPTLFNGTIEYNVRYNCPNISSKEIREACEAANALDFINDTPDGYQRDVGNRGEKMSGGQKQRLAIARILVRKPKILLFDEATSALDSQSEAIVQKALEEISKTQSSITIAHRISTIKDSDTIFVLESGQVVEKGKHSELMSLKGRFAELAHN